MKSQEDRAEHDLGVAAGFSSSSLESYFLVFRSPASLHFLASLAVGVAMRLSSTKNGSRSNVCRV